MDAKYLEQVYAALVCGNIKDGRKVVTTHAVRVQIVTDYTACKVVMITALSSNTNPVVVGGSTVVAAIGTRAGIPLAAGQSATIGIDDLSKLWLDSVTDGEGVSYSYLN